MAARLEAALGILSGSMAANLVAEVARDTVERAAGGGRGSPAAELYELGRRAALARVQAGGAHVPLVGAMVAAAGESRNTEAAAQLVAGAVEALVRGGAAHTAAGERAWAVLVALGPVAADARVLEPVVATLAEAGMADHVRQLAQGGVLLRTATIDAQPELVADLVGAGSLHDARWAADQVQALAVAMLLAQEQRGAGAVPAAAVARAEALARVAEAVAQRCFVDAVGVAPAALVPLWCTTADALAAAHFATLAHSRAGPDAFRRATTLLVAFMSAHSSLADAAVRRLFDMQPCLRFLARQPVYSVAPARSCVVLFYLDLLEHMAAGLQPSTLHGLVLPLAAHYAEATAGCGMADWFESAHAALLACLEGATAAAQEIVPWYTDLLLRQFPDAGITAELLRIAYTAAVRCVAARETPASLAAARSCIAGLVAKLDGYAPAGRASPVAAVVVTARRRELLGVLALQLAAVPMQMLPQLMSELRSRLSREPDRATLRALLDDIQRIVLDHADLPRKPALSTWVWRLLDDANEWAG
ncbi:hypothetical protein H4R19_002948 [Coemansia spiralis]|nr:hypothetical protein H4R19_002948 [Coemansia spiralis]